MMNYQSLAWVAIGFSLMLKIAALFMLIACSYF